MPDQPIRSTVSALSTFLAQNLPGSIDPAIIQGALSTYVALYSTAALPLTAIQPDFESNVAELQNILNTTSNPAWTNTAVAGTGETIIEMIATAQAFNQFATERALQESLLDFAQLPSSIYANVRNQGVRIARMIPSQITVNLTLPMAFANTVTINPFQQFSVGPLSFFNNSQIVFPANTTTLTGIELFQGTVNNATFFSTGLPLQTISLGSQDFTIADNQISVLVNGIAYSPTPFTPFFAVGLWEFTSTDNVFFFSTDASGNATLTFGDGTFGSVPPVNASIAITYCTTLGAAGNLALTGTTFSFSTASPASSGNIQVAIAGTVTSGAINGMNQRQAQEYKIIGPGTFPSKNRPSTLTDYNTFALNFPGVIDAFFQGQQSFAPTNLNFMMVVQVALLTSTPFTTTQFQSFVEFLTPFAGANLQFIQLETQAIPVNITANVFCTDQIPLSTLENLIIANLTTLFTPRAGYLGFSIFQSDIISIIKNSDPNGNIQIVQLMSPGTDLVVASNQFLTLGNVSLNMQVSNRNPVTTIPLN
jgi:hypothetical protein